MDCNKLNRNMHYAIFRDPNLNRILNVLPCFCDRFSKIERFFPFLDPLFFYILARFVKKKCHTFLKIALQCPVLFQYSKWP